MRPAKLFPLAFLLWVYTAAAQTSSGALTGEILDSSAAAIATARVTAIRGDTGDSLRSTTNSAGVYFLGPLKPGTYRVEVEAEGFRRSVRERVTLSTGERIRLDFALVPGPVRDEVTVSADAAPLKTESSNLGQVVDNAKIGGLPLNGRSFITLTALAAGVALPPGSAFPRISGGRPRTNEYLFDGISVLQPEPGQIAFSPIVDAIQEFNVQTNATSAEFGRFNGGVINLTTKAGTNEFHGTAFEFFRNEALNARNYFAPPNSAKPRFRRNQFGGVTGGPIIRDRTFFFADYQGTRQSIAQIRISTVPTELQRLGIFTEPVAGRTPVLFDPATTAPRPGGGFTRNPFPSNTIPDSRIDPAARLLLAHYPLPNLPGTVNNYQRATNEDTTQDQFDVRLDHRFASTSQIFGRYSQFREVVDPATPLPDGSGALSSGAIAHTLTVGQSAVLHFTHTFGTRALNDTGFGHTRRGVDRNALSLGSSPSTALQLPGIPGNGGFENAFPTFTISGFQQLGAPSNANTDLRTDVTQITNATTFQLGRHTLKAGLDFRWERLDILQPPSPTGQFDFNTLFTDLPGTPGTGFSLASFLLGQVNQFSIDLQQKVIRPRAHIQEYFLQDDWKLTPRLTVNAGVRYTLNFPSTEVNDQGAVFNLATQELDYLGKAGFPRSARELHKLNFGPRLGFAYRVTDKTVLRSGYGLVWIEQAGITTPFTTPQFPFLQTVAQRTLDNVSPAFLLANGHSVAPIPLTPEAGLGQGVFGVNRSLGSGYAQQWNLAIQREITPNLTFEIAYADNKITHLGIPDTNLNQLTVDQLTLGSALLVRVPNPFFGQIPRSSSLGDPTITAAQLMKPFPRFTTVSLYRNNVGNSNYHALQAKLQQRFAHGLTLLVSYTRSKLIDEASSVFDASILTGPVANFPVADSFSRRRERDVSTGDLPNVFVASYTYELPFGGGRSIRLHGLPNKLFGSWDMNGILTIQSGTPIAVTQATNFNAFAGFGTQRPNLTADPNLPPDGRNVTRWFNTAAFTIAPQFTLGNSSRNPVRGPNYRNFDLALIKRTAIAEKVSSELRVEIFNFANVPALGQPAAVLGNAGFGAITTAGDPRVIQLGLKILF